MSPKSPSLPSAKSEAATVAPTSRRALLVAIGVSILLSSFVPFGRTILYPFTLVMTWVHEMGHGLAALAVGGQLDSLDIFANASGLAHVRHSTSSDGVVCVAGLLAPPIAGAALLAFARGPKRARIALVVLATVMVLSLVLWVRSVAGCIALPLVAGLIAAFARWGSPRETLFLAQFIGLRAALDTVTSIDYVFTEKVTVDGKERLSDIARVAESWGGPMFFWSLVVAFLSFALVALGSWAAFRAARVVAKPALK